VRDQIGLVHLKHATPRPTDYPYPYPDFLWPVYVASFVVWRTDAKVEDDYEVSSRFLPLREVCRPPMADGEKAYLEAAVFVV